MNTCKINNTEKIYFDFSDDLCKIISYSGVAQR